MNINPEPFHTVDEAIASLINLKRTVGTGAAQFVIQAPASGNRFLLCQLEMARAGANNVYKRVSRSGRPVVIAVAVSTSNPAVVLNIDTALAQLQLFKEQEGTGNIPFLAQGANHCDLELCDLWPSKVGTTGGLRRVSRGGRPVVLVALTVPYKN